MISALFVLIFRNGDLFGDEFQRQKIFLKTECLENRTSHTAHWFPVFSTRKEEDTRRMRTNATLSYSGARANVQMVL